MTTGKAKGGGAAAAQDPISREEFEEFAAEIQKKLDTFAQGQLEMANVQADTGENLNRVQAETNVKLDKLTDILTSMVVRQSIPPDFRDHGDLDRCSSVHGNCDLGSPATQFGTAAMVSNTQGTFSGINTNGFFAPVYSAATRTTIPMLANLVPTVLSSPLGMPRMDGRSTAANTTQETQVVGQTVVAQQVTGVHHTLQMNHQGAPQIQGEFYHGGNGPGNRQRQLQFNEHEGDCNHRGQHAVRRNRQQGYEEQQYHTRHFAKGPKMDFPEFNGEQVEGWIKKANKYFKLALTADEQRVEIATLYFVGRADTWLDGSGIDTDEISWLSFCRKLKKRFAEHSEYDVVAAFHKIQQVTTVDAYIDQFESALREVRKDNPELPENYFIRSFVAGLKDYVQNLTQVQRPDSVHEAYWLARRYEQSYPFKKSTSGYSTMPQRGYSGGTNRYNSGIINKSTSYKPVKASVTTEALTENNNSTQKNDKCFRCNEKWFHGHKFHCKMNKQIKAMITWESDEEEVDLEETGIIEPEAEQEEINNNPIPDTAQLSLHAVQGTSSKVGTFVLHVHIGKTKAVALVDTGSTPSLILSLLSVIMFLSVVLLI